MDVGGRSTNVGASWTAIKRRLQLGTKLSVGAEAAGAKPNTVEMAKIDEVPLTCIPSNAILIGAKAAGESTSA